MPEVSNSAINPDWSPLQQVQVPIPAVLPPPPLQYHLRVLTLILQTLMLKISPMLMEEIQYQTHQMLLLFQTLQMLKMRMMGMDLMI